MADSFNLQRFVDAQAPVCEQARREILAGRKESHWMWFVFPQLAGLGQSAMSIRFAITSLDGAMAQFSARGLGSARAWPSALRAGPRAISSARSTT